MSDDRPHFVAHIDDVPEKDGSYPAPFDTEKMSPYRDLGRAVGSKALGFRLERLIPGARTSFTHAHSDEEEMAYVLSGSCHLRIIEPGGKPREIELRAGHVVSFPAGTAIAHTFVNHGTEECQVFVAGERKRELDRVFYAEDADYEEHFARTRPLRHWKR